MPVQHNHDYRAPLSQLYTNSEDSAPKCNLSQSTTYMVLSSVRAERRVPSARLAAPKT